MESAYSAVRTGDLNKAVCALVLKGFYNRDGKCLQRGTDWDLNKAVCAWVLKGFYNRDGKCLQRGTDWGFK
jgi:uncharacterized protein (DUF2237 family)